MRKLQKSILIALCSAVAVMPLSACGGKHNQAPTISGAYERDCAVGDRIDLLYRVTAIDPEKGDITDAMIVDVSPSVEIKDGYAIFESAGTYEVNYYVDDGDGESAEAFTAINVYARDAYRRFLDGKDFFVEVAGGAELTGEGVTDGKYTATVAGAQKPSDAALCRTYELIDNAEYAFTYKVNSSAMGSVRIFANDKEIAQKQIERGDDSFEFNFVNTVQTPAPQADEDDGETEDEDEEKIPTSEVQIDVRFGSLGEEITFGVERVDYAPLDALHEYVEQLEDFEFSSGNTRARADEGVACEVDIAETSATLKVTHAVAGKNWAGGMFVNTGIPLSAGDECVVDFKTAATGSSEYEVSLQNNDFDEKKYKSFFLTGNSDGNEYSFTVTDENKGTLWLYVQSGAAENEITLSDISVRLNAAQGKSISFDRFSTVPHREVGGVGSVKVENGKVVYTAQSFGSVDWHNRLDSSSFTVDGTVDRFIVSFKARSTRPIKTVFAVPTSGGWDPNLLYKEFTLEREEQYYFFTTDEITSVGEHILAWQFGAKENQRYSNVVIEISEIQISFRHGLLDYNDD